MNKFLFIISVFTLISCSQQKGNKKKAIVSAAEKTNGTTEIKFDEEIHDFGTLTSGEIVVSAFVFTNSGEHNLIITNVESGCGCVHVNFSKETVKPGERGLIEVEFNSSGMFGKQFKTIEIYANFKEPKHLAIFAAIKNEELEIKY